MTDQILTKMKADMRRAGEAAKKYSLKGKVDDAYRALGIAEGLRSAIAYVETAEPRWRPWDRSVAPWGLFLVRSTTVPYGPVQDGAHVTLASIGADSHKPGIWTKDGFWPWDPAEEDGIHAGMFSHYAEIPAFDGTPL